MASEPNPADQENETPNVPASAEDRKAAAALSNLDSRGADDDVVKKDVDTEALGKAMQNLSVNKKDGEQSAKKKVKVEAADVALLVDQLDLNKVKATELLKAHEGDAIKAMSAFITASV